jgi:hypothetical protein
VKGDFYFSGLADWRFSVEGKRHFQENQLLTQINTDDKNQ